MPYRLTTNIGKKNFTPISEGDLDDFFADTEFVNVKVKKIFKDKIKKAKEKKSKDEKILSVIQTKKIAKAKSNG